MLMREGWRIFRHLAHMVCHNTGKWFSAGYLKCCEWTGNWRMSPTLCEASLWALINTDGTGIAFIFFRLSVASLLGGGKKNTELIILFTLLRQNYADFMIRCKHLVPSPYPSSVGEMVVEEGRKSSRGNVERWKRTLLCPFCLCNQHPHLSPNTALKSSPALAAQLRI